MYQPIKSSLQKQLKKLVPLILLIALPPVALIIFLAASSVIYEIPIDHFSRDPLAILDGPLYLGLLSNLGALLWCSVATLALFTYASVRGQVDPQAARFLLAGGTITALFCLDDLFMLHEKVLPTLFSLPEHFTCAVYVFLLLTLLLGHLRTIKESEFLLLFLALAGFGFSQLIDLVGIKFPGWPLVEDGCKFLGIVFWGLYFWRFGRQQLRKICR